MNCAAKISLFVHIAKVSPLFLLKSLLFFAFVTPYPLIPIHFFAKNIR